MTETDLLADLEKTELFMPKTYFNLITEIDRFIFGAQHGFELASELLAIYIDGETAASVAFKKALSKKYYEASSQGVAPSARKEYATMNSCDEDVAFTLAEGKVRVWKLVLSKWMERVNSYKRIKGESSSQRVTS